MYKLLKLKAFFLLMAFSYCALGAYYDTLPKGVRTFVYRNVETSNVDSSFNQKESLAPYNYSIQVDGQLLAGIEQIQPAINQIRVQSEYAYQNLLAGRYEISGDARVQVDGFGFGWGLTNKLTAYGILPYFQANVNVTYKRSASNNFQEISDYLENQSGSGQSQIIGQALDQLPDVGAGVIQYAIRDEFEYKDLGNWQASDFGDLELGFMYNLYANRKWGTAIAGGVVVPTGRVDDPDLLQDFGFGDGQWDVFLEFGGGYHIGNDLLINSFIRYTYQLPTEKEFRVPESLENTLSNQRGLFNEKLGNMVLWNVNADFMLSDWFSVIPAYQYEFKEENTYESAFGAANDILAFNTNLERHIGRLNLEFSSVKLFQSERFLLPGKIIFGYQNTFAGTNTPKVEQYEIEFRMFF